MLVTHSKDRTMSRRKLSFTERRRARLAMKWDRLERLESKQTITEPISVAGLSISAFRGLAQLGIMQADGGNGALLAQARATQQARQTQIRTPHSAPVPNNALSLALSLPTNSAASAAAGGGSVQGVALPASTTNAARPINWLALGLIADPAPEPSHGISTPWHPANRAGAGPPWRRAAARAAGHRRPRRAMLAGRGGRAQASSAPALPATIPGYLASRPLQGAPALGAQAPIITRGTAARHLAGAGPGSPGSASASASPGSGPTIVAENPSSLPSSSVGNGSGSALLSFPYFPLYVLDENSGIVLFNNEYQQASLSGVYDLEAQVKGTSVSTYSWTTSNLNIASSSGASTYHFHFQLQGTEITPTVGSATLTVTDSNSHQESQTFYFLVPTANVVTLPTSSSWPTTIAPDLVEPGAPIIASQGVAVDANSGALDSVINLPSYNPNIPALSLTYNSMTANPLPIIVVPHTLDPSQAVPDHGQRHPDVQLRGRNHLVLQHVVVDSRRRPADRAPGQRDQPEHGPVRLLGAGGRRAVDQHDLDLHRHGHGAQPVDKCLRRRLDLAGPGAGHPGQRQQRRDPQPGR